MVTISGGEISSPVALSVANPQKNGTFSDFIGTVSINITGGTFTSTSKDSERKIIREKVDFNYNGKDETVIKYAFTGKNAIFNADDRVDISISNATIRRERG